jgi:hypothetical protein
MHDINPLATILYLKELDRQAMPKLHPLPFRRPAVRGVAALSPPWLGFVGALILAFIGAWRGHP